MLNDVEIKNTNRGTESKIKPLLQKWLSLLLACLNTLYFVLNIIFIKQLDFAAIQLVTATLGYYFFWTAINNRYQAWQNYVLMGLLSAHIMTAVFIMDLTAGAIFWSLALPLWYYLLFGLRQGFCFTALIGIVSIVILILRPDTSIFMPYRTVFNFTLAYSSIWVVCHMYEVQRQKNNTTLQKLALEDALTGLQNRHALTLHFNTIGKGIQTDNIFMLLIDIDHFKQVNDQFGHDTGDIVLKETANLMKRYFRTAPIYRLGGEEFIVMLSGTSKENAYQHAEDVRKNIEHSDAINKITVSVGLAQWQQGHSFNTLFNLADKNLYKAKNNGRNQVCFD